MRYNTQYVCACGKLDSQMLVHFTYFCTMKIPTTRKGYTTNLRN